MTDCQQQTPGSFEDDVLTVLIQWIHYLTGVKTVRAYEKGTIKEQYVTVFVNSESETVEEYRKYCTSDDDELFEHIVSIEQLTVDIRVYQDSGSHVNGGSNTVNNSPSRSAFDVARAIKKRSLLDGGMKKLTDNCMQVERFGEVQNLRNMVKQDFECRAFMQIKILAETNEFGRLDCIEQVELKACLDDDSVIIDDTKTPMGC